MQALRRWAGGDPGIVADAAMGIAAAGLTAVAVGGPPGLVGTAIAGPVWLRALLPLLLGAPLVLRRRAPVLMWLAIWAALALLALLTDYHPQGLEFTFVLLAAAYSLGAHASLRRAVPALAVTAPVVAEISDKGGLGLAYRALKAGASGFLLKDASRDQLTGGVRAVAAGETLLAPAVTRRLIEDFCNGPAPRAPGAPVAGAAGGLTERELGVVRLVAQGLSNAEIAARLYLSEATVKSHIARILAKLGLRDRVQVAVYAYEQGIVRPGRGV